MADSKLTKLNMAEFKLAAIIKLSQNEWVKVFFVQNGWIQMADFKIAAIIKLSQNEQVKFFWANSGNQSWQV